MTETISNNVNVELLDKTDSGTPEVRTREFKPRRVLSKKLLITLIVLILILFSLLVLSFGLATYYFEAYRKCQNPNNENANFDFSLKPFDEFITKRPVQNVRLPYTALPQFYKLVLQVHLHEGKPKDFFFNGSVSIKLFCANATDVIFVHAHNELKIDLEQISISRLDLLDNLVEKINIFNITYDLDLEWYRIKLETFLIVNASYKIEFKQFRSMLTKDLKGWYLSEYEENGKQKYLATSQLQPTDARRVFPCWDEPAFKAQFQVVLIRKKDFQSLSNMALKETKPLHGDWFSDQFEVSVNMSTYLLAFVVSQFESIKGTDSKGRNFSVWARPEKIKSAKYALETGLKIIEFFEKYFEVPYPLNKTDMIAVPDFAAGAMENWGLMIYREATMLWDPLYGTAVTQQKVATVISHEIAHQWFGNLVTLEWWDDLWLNEGFASFVEYIGVNYVHPEWGMDEQFLLDDIQKVLVSDSLVSSRPVIQPVYYPNEINEIFDPISYNKGASVLRMMKSFMGQDAFRAALKSYLQKHQFKNTVHNDLWRSLAEAAKNVGKDVDVKSVMDTWMLQMNYPLVTVKKKGMKEFEFTQSHFLEPKDAKSPKNPSPYNFTWQIPLTYGSKITQKWDDLNVIWMPNKTMIQRLDIADNDWYLFNIKQAGFYRVHYADNNWRLLTTQLMTDIDKIPLHSRTQILDDLFNLANRGTVSYNVYLDLTQYLKNENQYVAWETARRALNYLDRMLTLDSSYRRFQTYIRSLVDKPLKSVNWSIIREDENHMQHMLRLSLTRLSCQVEHYACVRMAKNLYARWMEDETDNRIPVSLRLTVYCTAIRMGGLKEWNFLHKFVKSYVKNDEDNNVLAALACSKDIWIIKTYFDRFLNSSFEENQEFPDAITYVALNPIGQMLLMDRLRDALRHLKNLEINATNINYKGSLIKIILKILSKRHYTLNNVHSLEEIKEMCQTIVQKEGLLKREQVRLKQTNDNSKATVNYQRRLEQYQMDIHLIKRSLAELLKHAKENTKWNMSSRKIISRWLEMKVPENKDKL